MIGWLRACHTDAWCSDECQLNITVYPGGGGNAWFVTSFVFGLRGQTVYTLLKFCGGSDWSAVGTAHISKNSLSCDEQVWQKNDGHCCPSGRRLTQWKWNGRTFVKGAVRTTRKAATGDDNTRTTPRRSPKAGRGRRK